MNGSAIMPVTSESEVPGFDYDGLAPEVADEVRETARRVKDRCHRHVNNILEIGRDLLALKGRLDYGQFGVWLASEFPLSHRTALNYMRAAEIFSDRFAMVANLSPAVLFLLAAPSTPEAVRVDVVKQSEASRLVTEKEVRHLIADRRKQTRAELVPPGPDQASAGEQKVEHISLPEPVESLAPAPNEIGSGGQQAEHAPPPEPDGSIEPVVARSSRQQAAHTERPEPNNIAESSDTADKTLTAGSWATFVGVMTTLCSQVGESGISHLQKLFLDDAKQYVEGYKRGALAHDAGKTRHESPKGRSISNIFLSGWGLGWLAAEIDRPQAGRKAPQQHRYDSTDDKLETQTDHVAIF